MGNTFEMTELYFIRTSDGMWSHCVWGLGKDKGKKRWQFWVNMVEWKCNRVLFKYNKIKKNPQITFKFWFISEFCYENQNLVSSLSYHFSFEVHRQADRRIQVSDSLVQSRKQLQQKREIFYIYLFATNKCMTRCHYQKPLRETGGYGSVSVHKFLSLAITML